MDLSKEFLRNVLKSTNLEERYIPILLNRIDDYQKAFTSKAYDSVNNYELYEILGDATANWALLWYFYRTFPQLHCANGVKTYARLKINYSDTESFSRIADSLGFWPYIKANDDEKLASKPKLLEDVFESFIGATSVFLDDHFGYPGVGAQIVYNIIASLYDKIDISLKDEDLYDAKTRLKEIFDKASVKEQWGSIKYQHIDGRTDLYFVKNAIFTKISTGYGNTKVSQEKEAAKQAIAYLAQRGIDTKKKVRLLCEP